MRIIHVNTSDQYGGAARSAYRLHASLKKAGVDSRMYVQDKEGGDGDVYSTNSKIGKLWAKIRPYIDRLPASLFRYTVAQNFSPAIVPGRAASQINSALPDIVHLHWIAMGFIRIETLKQFRQKPLVWTLHDSWAFTGGCHLPFTCTTYTARCGKCPALGSGSEYDLSRWVWNRKARIFDNLDLTVVTPSRWLGECAKRSSLFKKTRVEVIPNGLDINTYKPLDQSFCRDVLSLPKDKKVIMFGAMSSTSDKNKGFHYLVEALRRIAATSYKDEVVAVVLGADAASEDLDIGIDIRFLGRLHDDTSLAVAYSAADVFVAPSIQENLSNTVMESMACAIPCVAFDIGGMPDMIEHKRTGYLAVPYEASDLADGISWVISDQERGRELSSASRKKIEEGFSDVHCAEQYALLYRELHSC
ncbi:MAG TPA: glycosyltransferase [Gammaproteobacteria bacterium]|nr:glycosyltransferase [Gammaproteobacteria bacterium]